MPLALRNTALLVVLGILFSACRESRSETVYVCPPCAPHDTLTFEHDGECPVCGMKLIEETDPSRVGEVHIHEGSGSFLVEGGPGRREKVIRVYYHRPERFTPRSPILLVIPGAGRNAWDYRDAWLEASEQHGVLVLSPNYPEATYGFGDYHMARLVEETDVLEVGRYVDGSDEFVLDEERLTVEVNADEREWIFRDFDRLFEEAASAVGSERNGYDAFGHSAGGQILHRSVLFHPNSRADRIVAANAGFYTLPDREHELFFGLKDTPVREDDLKFAFRRRLVLLLGEDDDHSGAGGTFLRSTSADQQGPGRLQRGRHFYQTGRAKAEAMGVEFNWEIETVPGVGHDFEAMSEAAAELLYGEGTRR